ncbi:unnamed protein product, partial [Brachionus calyciflorus]
SKLLDANPVKLFVSNGESKETSDTQIKSEPVVNEVTSDELPNNKKPRQDSEKEYVELKLSKLHIPNDIQL